MHNYLLTEGLSHNVLYFELSSFFGDFFFLFFHKQMT